MIRARPLRVGALNTHTITEDPLKYSSNYFLYHSSLNNFILPLNNSNEGLLNWLDKSNPFMLLGSIFYGRVNIAEYYRDQNLKEFYDYLIHFDNTTNSVRLPR